MVGVQTTEPGHPPSTDERNSPAQPGCSSSPLKCTSHLGFSLDIRYQLETMELVKGLGLTTLAALHDLNIAATYCDFIHVIDNGQIVASGRTDEVLLPRLIEDVFGVGARVGTDPLTGRLWLNFYLNEHAPLEDTVRHHT